MELKSILAVLLTLLALVLVFSVGVWFSYGYFIRFTRENYCDHFLVTLEPELGEVKLEVGKGTLVKVKLTNLGFEDEFKIKIDGPEWIIVKPERIRLNMDESEDAFVYMSPSFDAEGIFFVKISASSYCGCEQESIRVEV